MANGLHNAGEELVIKEFFTDEKTRPTSATVGLYDDSTDTLADGDTYADITTEPSDGNYAAQTVNFGNTDWNSGVSGGDWQAILSDIVFDVTDTTGSVDSFYVTVTFTSEEHGDAGDTQHLLFTASLSQTRDLSQNTELTLTGGGLSLT